MFQLSSLWNGPSWDSALSLALASKLAYERNSTVENIASSSWEFDRCRGFEAGSARGFVAATNDVLLIAFGGSESICDWIGNFDLRLEDRGYANVNRSFAAAFDLVKEQLASALSQIRTAGMRTWLTGHGLGGALATIAAAEFREVLESATVLTFGQPQVGDETLQALFETDFPFRFYRLVNDDDVVARVPPSYSPVGQLVHFDGSGRVQFADSKAHAAQIQPAPLSIEEFERLRKEIHRVRAALAKEGRSASGAALDQSVEGFIPGSSFVDHKLERYIAAIRRWTGATSVDAALSVESDSRAAQESVESSGGARARKRPTDEVSVVVRVTDEGWVPPPGIVATARIGSILTARGTLEKIQQLANDPTVTGIEISREGGHHELVDSVPFVSGDQVHGPAIGERGDRALVGIIDTGIDVMHEAFLDGQGKTRILAIWNQHDAVGPSPNAIDTTFPSTLGRLWLASDIQQMVNLALPVPPELRDPGAHGTHVASIAAGRAVGGLGNGMAPDAGIVVVMPKLKSNPADPVSVGYSASHLEALDFLKRVAAGHNTVLTDPLPMAVNVSLGMNAGAHDGTSLLEAGFDSITHKGRDPGFVVVKSAGNERGFGGHARIQAFNGLMPITWESDATFRYEDYFEVWYGALDDLEFTLVDPAGNASPVVSHSNKKVTHTLGGNVALMELVERHVDNGDNRLVIQIAPQSAQIQAGQWSLNVQGVNVRSRDPVVNVWVERDDARAVRFSTEVPEVTLSIPGTADTVITVAACHVGAPLQLTSSSSFGPTRDGRAKPDLCAPGKDITAALAGNNNYGAGTSMTGTSMAAPHVTGALALVFSHRAKQLNQPQHNARQLRAALISTTRFSGVHNPGPGHGMLDAKALFDLLK
ncbi:S8 family serine peptidase [Paraburkholderia sp. SEWSISQ10-3 4]|uniref:S8 family serine peptidase n=1 Tax=Paraburkholderia TaxID=1822464 RepID=UPI00224E2A26|nr:MULTISPECIES: S8 family serine peptidase [Paraburkholderia]MCX4137897.1 S8 family serine peptidase [Paraburkholderia aspalathi]MDN7170588.1 S8 family serine peptidase [Paraburkholderia sp. SEWSISQ10-3 4]MDQ6500227.1 S8 family serine peptidase [Paraburkholderia aspalathi]